MHDLRLGGAVVVDQLIPSSSFFLIVKNLLFFFKKKRKAAGHFYPINFICQNFWSSYVSKVSDHEQRAGKKPSAQHLGFVNNTRGKEHDIF